LDEVEQNIVICQWWADQLHVFAKGKIDKNYLKSRWKLLRVTLVTLFKDDIQSNLRMREKHCFQNKPYHYNYMKYDILYE
jgi:hypothetical protein